MASSSESFAPANQAFHSDSISELDFAGSFELGDPNRADGLSKRVLDIVLGLAALILFAPLMLLIACIIRLDSHGPALYRQSRYGKSRRIIQVYEFRTMYSCQNSQFRPAVLNDPRVTRIGKVLRKTRLDELPQLFNVLNGTMSLVGPRPHPIALDIEFKSQIPYYHSRYLVKPGITGLAQIKGYRGETRALRDSAGRVDFDRLYIARWNTWLDIRILLVTATKGWGHKNAY